MVLGKVIGTVVSTRKDEKLVGCKLLVVQLVDQKLNPLEETMVAVDTVGAGIGEDVLMVTGSAARQTMNDRLVPIDLTIVGIIDVVKVV